MTDCSSEDLRLNMLEKSNYARACVSINQLMNDRLVCVCVRVCVSAPVCVCVRAGMFWKTTLKKSLTETNVTHTDRLK